MVLASFAIIGFYAAVLGLGVAVLAIVEKVTK